MCCLEREYAYTPEPKIEYIYAPEPKREYVYASEPEPEPEPESEPDVIVHLLAGLLFTLTIVRY